MSAWEQIVLYGHERAATFLARVRADIPARFGDGPRVVERHAGYFRPNECEPATAVYVEARFTEVVTAYRARGVTVLTDADLQEPSHDGPDAQEARQPPDERLAAEGEGRAQVVEPAAFGARRGRRRGG